MLAVKFLLTPLLIMAATLITKRYGAVFGGMLTGLPIVAGPITVFLFLEQGQSFALQSAAFTLRGVFAVAVFCLVYSWAALRLGVVAALLAALGGYAGTVFLTSLLTAPLGLIYLGVLATILLCLALTPRVQDATPNRPIGPVEILARMLVSALLVLAVTRSAALLGANLSGYLAAFPVATLTMTLFTHSRSQQTAVVLLKGVLVGLFGLATFYLALIVAAASIPFGHALLAALAITLLLQLLLQLGQSRVQSALIRWRYRQGRGAV